MSFASRFAEGARVAQGLIDTYDKARLQRDIKEVGSAKPVVAEEFMPEDGEQLEAAAKAINPDTKQPYYNIAAKDGGYEVGLSESEREIAEKAGSDPNMGGLIRPKTVTKFLGKTHEGTLDDTRLNSLRQRGMVDVMTKSNPMEGMRLNAALDDADATRLARERAGEVYDRQKTEWGQSDALKNATAAVQSAKTPEEAKQAKEALLAIPGGLDVYAQTKTTQDAIYNTNRDALARVVLPMAERGDLKGLVDAYSKYHDGRDARIGEGNTIEIYDEKTNEVVQTIKFADNKELRSIMFRALYPDRAAEADAKAEAEMMKRQDARDFEVFKHGLKGGTSGAPGGSPSKAPEAAPASVLDRAVSNYRSLTKDLKNDMVTPQTVQKAVGYMELLAANNPGIKSSETLSRLGEAIALDDTSLTPAFSPDGVPMLAFADPNQPTDKYYVKRMDTGPALTKENRAALTAQAGDFMVGVVGPANRDLAIRAFRGETGKMAELERVVFNKVHEEVAAAKMEHAEAYRKAGKKPPQIDVTAENHRKQAIQKSRINALRNASPFFMDLKTQPAPTASPGKVSGGISWDENQLGGMHGSSP
jgi:hypothetical protein